MSVAAIPAVNDLLGLNRSTHASTQHSDQKWNADTITAAMTGGSCGEVTVWTCPDDRIIYTCTSPTNPANALGVIVGKTSQRVVTSYAAAQNYWLKQVSKCTPNTGITQ